VLAIEVGSPPSSSPTFTALLTPASISLAIKPAEAAQAKCTCMHMRGGQVQRRSGGGKQGRKFGEAAAVGQPPPTVLPMSEQNAARTSAVLNMQGERVQPYGCTHRCE